jgi:hypothetical protein
MSTNFIHKTCKSIIYVDASAMFQIIAENLVIGARSVKISGQANIIELNGQGKFSFFCPECKKNNILLEDVLIGCGHCGELIPLNVAYKATGVSGVYCKKHISLVTDASTFTIENALKNFIIR